MRYVYVLDVDGKPLMPTYRYGKVRRMLKSGQAKVVETLPFTIQLAYKTKTHILQPVTIGQDPGRTNIGIAVVRSDGTELGRFHCTTRNKEIPKLMANRKMFRSTSRRGERLIRKRLARKHGTLAKNLNGRMLPGCEKPVNVKDIINTEARFNNRLRPEKWLTPTATQLLRTHINLINRICKILPVTDVALEVNRFAFMQLDNPDMKKQDIDFCHGPLYRTGGLEAAVKEQQDGICLLCGKAPIDHYHHIIPRSKRGSNTIANIAGLCAECHNLVHKDADTTRKLLDIKTGLMKKYGGTSVLNQIIPALVKKLAELFPGHLHVTNGWNTKEFREKHGLEKDHDVDAYCIGCSWMTGNEIKIHNPKVQTEPFEILQFRKHNRANIHHQTERAYKLDSTIIAKNRKKRMEQKSDSLDEWYADMVIRHGIEQADTMRSKLTVTKSTRYYNTPGRIMPGNVFRYEGKRYVMTGQLTNGKYLRAYGTDKKNFSVAKIQILQKNTGLVFVA